MTNTAIDRLRSLLVEDVMNPNAFAVRLDQTLAETAEFFGQRHITWAPVVNEDGVCVGVFSVADLLKPKQNAGEVTFNSQETVRAYARTRIFTASPDEMLLAAVATMTDNHVHRLPVVDRAGRLQGVLSTMDVAAALLNAVEEMDASLLSNLRRETNSAGA